LLFLEHLFQKDQEVIFGFDREQIIIPKDSYFIENYFKTFNPEFLDDYQYAIARFMSKTFSGYIGQLNDMYKLHKMNLDGRLEVFYFLSNLLTSAIEGMTLKHPGQETWLMNQLMKNIVSPKAEVTDLVRKLLFLQSC